MRISTCTAVIAASVLAVSFEAAAQDADFLVRKLQPQAAQPEGQLTRSLKRGIVIEGAAKPAETPQVDLQIGFEYRSAELTNDGRLALDTLAKALGDKRLSGMQFLVVGHTDARGGDDYNIELSTRRAEAVKAYLVSAHKVEASRLTAQGKGRTQLADPSRPEHAVNRRVQIINQSAVSATN